MTTFTRRLVVPFVALVVAGCALAPTASAHTLSTERAETKLQGLSDRKVKRSDGEYVKATAFGCRRLYPHLVRCKAGYHTRSSLRTKRYDCTETVDVKYRAHSEAGDSRLVFYVTVGHDC